ncbi:MAG: DUF4424 domain-containing protein [Rhizobiaceae bacterium]|nr:DUF4424 domain-containing protein [Rhizobiaceae bacterium]
MALPALGPALANDTMAKLDTGGLVWVRTDSISIASEDLFISENEVRVAYQFRNDDKVDVESIVAFPMPDIHNDPYFGIAIPEPGIDNFLSFTVEMDGRALTPQLEQRAFSAELDVTAELKAAAVPVNPIGDAALAAVKKLPREKVRDWLARGIVARDVFAEDPDRAPVIPAWTMKSTYWWKAKFPAGKTVSVKHRYRPSVGGTTGISFWDWDAQKVGGSYLEEYRYKYCLDAGIERAMNNAAKQNDGYPNYWENWISYVLTTGGHWGGSTIEKFTLTIDKGSPKNLVSFCGQDVKKIGPTTFQMVAENFYPDRDLDILILKKFEDTPSSDRAFAPQAPQAPGREAERGKPTPMASPAGDTDAEN